MMGTAAPATAAAPAPSDFLERWTRARPQLHRVLRLLNTLTGTLPTSGHIGAGTRRSLRGEVVRTGEPAGTRDVLGPIDALLTEAAAPVLLAWTGDVYFSDEPAPDTTTMGQVASASLTEAARRLVEAATARADEQTRAIETFLTGLADNQRRLDYFARWSTAIANLLNDVRVRGVDALRGVVTTGGSALRQWLIEWHATVSDAWQAFRSGLGLSAFGIGVTPILLIILAVYLATRKKGKR